MTGGPIQPTKPYALPVVTLNNLEPVYCLNQSLAFSNDVVYFYFGRICFVMWLSASFQVWQIISLWTRELVTTRIIFMLLCVAVCVLVSFACNGVC